MDELGTVAAFGEELDRKTLHQDPFLNLELEESNKAKAQAAGVEFSDEQAAKAESNLVGLFNREADALAATARLFDDGLIDPRDTRRVLGFTLAICQDAKARDVAPNSFGVARL